MEIKNSVRCISKKGQEYLEKLEEAEAAIEPVKPVEPVPAPAPKPKKKPVRIKLPAPAAEIVVPKIPEDLFELIRNRER